MRRGVVRGLLVALGASLLVAVVPEVAFAHGSATSPGSRTYLCYTDGHHTGGDLQPRNTACLAAVAAGGKQPLWDWFGENRSDGGGRMRGYIPDGKLCSGGNPKYAAYDLARADWPATHLTSGAAFTTHYNAWAPHPGVFTLYVTKDGYDPRKPLTWDALEAKPFSTWSETTPNGAGEYTWKTTLPAGKTGRHIIYSVWSRTDSKETFYNCSDVVFDGGHGQVSGYPGAEGGAGTPDLQAIDPPAAKAQTNAPQPQQPSTAAAAQSPAAEPAGQADTAPAAAAAAVSAATGPAAAPAPVAIGGTPGSCTALVTSRALQGGRMVQVSVVNHGPPLDPWTVTVDTARAVPLVAGWSGAVSVAGGAVTVAAPTWHSGLEDGEQTQVGFIEVGTDGPPASAAVSLNGLACQDAAGTRGGGAGRSSAPAVAAAGAVVPAGAAAPAPAVVSAAAAGQAVLPATAGAAQPSGQQAAQQPAPAQAAPAPAAPAPVAAPGCGRSVICDGFEGQSGATPSGAWAPAYPDCKGTGSVHVDAAVAHSGTRSIRVDGATGYCNHAFVALAQSVKPLGSTIYVRVWMRHLKPLPPGHVAFLTMSDANDGGKDLRVGGQSSALQWNRSSDDATLPEQSPTGIAGSRPLPTAAWQCLEIGVNGAAGTAHTWLGGVEIKGLAADGVKTQNVDGQWYSKTWRPALTNLRLGWESYADGSDTLWFDDLAVSTSRIGC